MVSASEAGVTGSGSVSMFGAGGDDGWAMRAILAVHGGGFAGRGLEERTTFGMGRVGRIPHIGYGEGPESLSVSVNVKKLSDMLLSSTSGGGLTMGTIPETNLYVSFLFFICTIAVSPSHTPWRSTMCLLNLHQSDH